MAAAAERLAADDTAQALRPGDAEAAGDRPDARVADGPEATERLASLAAAAFPAPSGWQAVKEDGLLWMAPDAPAPRPGASVCALGAFDGAHLGHRALLADARRDADARGLPLVAVTFDPDPSQVLAPRPQAALLPCSERREALARLGVDAVASFSFTPELAALSYDEFLRRCLVPALHPASLHVGEGFCLGAGGAGTVARLADAGRDLGFDVQASPLACLDGRPVSASRIRRDVEDGHLDQAARLLGRPPVVRGTVVHGRGEGAGMGFPTANVQVAPGSCLPRSGVYAGIVRVGGQAWPAAVNVGAPPTFSSAGESEAAPEALEAVPRPLEGATEPLRGTNGSTEAATITIDPLEAVPGFLEAALLGFEGDLYGQEVQVALVRPLRASRPFSSVEGLQEAVRGNIAQTEELLGARPVLLYSQEGLGTD